MSVSRALKAEIAVGELVDGIDSQLDGTDRVAGGLILAAAGAEERVDREDLLEGAGPGGPAGPQRGRQRGEGGGAWEVLALPRRLEGESVTQFHSEPLSVLPGDQLFLPFLPAHWHHPGRK